MRLLSLSLTIMCAGVCSASQPPNILLIMADDLGFSDLSCYGGEIDTPNLDRLAAGGLRFTQFYNTGRCWPTRASLLTGFYPHQVGRDEVPGVRSGGRGRRPAWAPLLSATLAADGYRCYHSGKWHLDGMPLGNGFHSSYYLKDQHRFFNPTISYRDDVQLPAVKRESGFYGTTAIADHMLQMLQGHHEKYAAKPFFAYLAFTAPHFPLHAPAEDIKRNLERYQEGWEQIRQARWKRIQQLGLVSGRLSDVESAVGSPYPDRAAEAHKILGDSEVVLPLPWDQLSADQKSFQVNKMAIHAAMVDRMDQEIGRVLVQLKKMSAMDNTLILFLSDNGASAEIMVRGDGHEAAAPMGSASSHLCLGAGWSTTANTPFRRHKVWVHEGGIATPLIVHWPRGIKARGELRTNPGHVIDVVPTVLEVVGKKNSANERPKSGPLAPGKSLVPAFSTDGTVEREYLWWHHEGHRAIRVGNWKLVAAAEDKDWSLYDVAADRTESHNRAGDKPGIARRLAADWERRWQKIQEDAKQGAEE
jgi:arylsulfatase A-like enzyme